MTARIDHRFRFDVESIKLQFVTTVSEIISSIATHLFYQSWFYNCVHVHNNFLLYVLQYYVNVLFVPIRCGLQCY